MGGGGRRTHRFVLSICAGVCFMWWRQSRFMTYGNGRFGFVGWRRRKAFGSGKKKRSVHWFFREKIFASKREVLPSFLGKRREVSRVPCFLFSFSFFVLLCERSCEWWEGSMWGSVSAERVEKFVQSGEVTCECIYEWAVQFPGKQKESNADKIPLFANIFIIYY